MKSATIILLASLFFSLSLCAQNWDKEIFFSETYELANVILALTPYGISDPSEVQKGTAYYADVLQHFQALKSHPLLEKVNYSRERWEEYLSFRTDAFAFEVGADGKIRRSFSFFANRGKPFDDNLELIQDFYEKSNFRAFYQKHQAYYDAIVKRYKSYYMVEEMRQFLKEEFGVFKQNQKNLVVLSPLVNRMNCHRSLNKTTSADFATLGISMLNPETAGKTDQAQRASEIHMLFTEMDHGYVNPTSDKYAKLIKQKFKYQFWDNKSGYTKANCFNEYMTWAVYDLFVLKYFPNEAEQPIRDWHFQNNDRGFIASSLFGKKLRALYETRSKGQCIKDLYPAILDWTAVVQHSLKMPVLVQDSTTVSLKDISKPITIPFSEPLQKVPVLESGLFKVVNGQRELVRVLTLEEGKTIFFEGSTLRISIPGGLPEEPGLYGVNFNVWGRKHELLGQSGVSAKCPSRFFVRVTGG